MGPALMDDEWRYGGRIDQIAATIMEGRPGGMPSFAEFEERHSSLWQQPKWARGVLVSALHSEAHLKTGKLSVSTLALDRFQFCTL